MTAGDIYTIAGTGSDGSAPDGVVATAADLSPELLTTDRSGNLVFFDDPTRSLRVVAATSGTFYGVPMTAGHLYSIVGGSSTVCGLMSADRTAGVCQHSGSPDADLGVSGLAHAGQGITFADETGVRVRFVAG